MASKGGTSTTAFLATSRRRTGTPRLTAGRRACATVSCASVIRHTDACKPSQSDTLHSHCTGQAQLPGKGPCERH
eukprot:13648618-Alexandrium_andersonii.AAC.1